MIEKQIELITLLQRKCKDYLEDGVLLKPDLFDKELQEIKKIAFNIKRYGKTGKQKP